MVSGFSTAIAKGLGRIGVIALFAAAVGCGGRVIEQDPQPNDPGVSSSGGSTDTSSRAGSAGKSSTGGALPAHPLGSCVPGFDRTSNPTRACQWLTKDGQCFDTFDAACACACPASGNSVCSSASPGGPNSATPIFCDQT